MARRYAFLRFRSGVDYQHVNAVLLVRLNRLGMALGKIITITSGARTPENNTGASGSHHVPGNNPSGKGEAVDAYIGKQQIGSVVSERMFKRYGLYSGNRPGFYKGKPDPMHVETLERRTGETPATMPSDGGGAAAMPQAEQPAAAPSPDQSIPTVQPAAVPGGPPSPQEALPGVAPPGAIPADGSATEDPVETWRLIAAQPLASDESRLFASRMTGG